MGFKYAKPDENLDEPRLVPTTEAPGCKRQANTFNLVARDCFVRRWEAVGERLRLLRRKGIELSIFALHEAFLRP